jgi:hypothetical protein
MLQAPIATLIVKVTRYQARRPKGKTRIDHPETLTTQDTGRRQTKQRSQHITRLFKNEDHGPHQKPRMKPRIGIFDGLFVF